MAFMTMTRRHTTGELIRYSSAKDAGLLILDPSPGMKLWLKGTRTDLSGFNNHVVASGGNAAPAEITSALDSKPALRFTPGTRGETPFFLTGAEGATLYVVYTTTDEQFNLIKTSALDDYWRFSDGNGYFGVFRGGSRANAFPAGVPSTGSHLFSVHASASVYEVLQNNASKGTFAADFYPGDFFWLGDVGGKEFLGDINEVIVYPEYIAKTSQKHAQTVTYLKSRFPSVAIA